MLQPFPKFYIIRPDGSLTPLVPVDELPKWLSFANWDPEDVSMYSYMYAATLASIPREGEYDLVCHHCSAQVDGHHRSVSEQSDLGIPLPTPARSYGDTINMSGSCSIDTPAPAPSQLTAVPVLQSILKQPPFQANLYSPFVGMCLVSFPRLRWPFRFGSTTQDDDQDSTEEEDDDDDSHSHHSGSDGDHDSESGDSLLTPPLQTPLLEAMDMPMPRPDQQDVDLELGFGTSAPSQPRYLDVGSAARSTTSQSDEGLTMTIPNRRRTAEDVPPRKSALLRRVSSRRGVKKVRFNSVRLESTPVK